MRAHGEHSTSLVKPTHVFSIGFFKDGPDTRFHPVTQLHQLQKTAPSSLY